MLSKDSSYESGEPLLAQKGVWEYLNASYEGPVPEVALYRLVNVTEHAVRAELERQEFAGQLGGVALGYYAPLQGSNDLDEFYAVGCGQLPQGDEDYERTYTDDPPDLDPAENPLSFAFVDQLAEQLKQIMVEVTPPEDLEGRELVARVYGTLIGSSFCWGMASCNACGSNRKAYYYWFGECRIWCSSQACF